jgi:superfamily I DNA/RNA helicase
MRNYRSSPKLIQLQNMLAANLLGSEVVCVPDPHKKNDDGAATFYFFDDHEHEATQIAAIVQDLVINQGIPPREIVILFKAQPDRYGEKLIEELAARSIDARVENEFQELMTEPIVKFVVDLLKVACGSDDKEARRRIVYEYCRFNHITTDHALLLEELRVIQTLKELQACVNKAANWTDIERMLHEIISDITFSKFSAHYPQYNELKYFNKCKQDCCDHLRRAYVKCDDLNQTLKTFLGEASIPLMTVHKSKGLEFEVVFFVGFEDQTFWSYQKQPAEDTRSFFVALSRAKKHINFTFCTSRINNFGQKDTRAIKHILPIYDVLAKSKLVSAEDRRRT